MAPYLLAAVVGLAVGLGVGLWARRRPAPAPAPVAQDEPLPAGEPEDLLPGPLAQAVDRVEHGVVVVDGNGDEIYRNIAAQRIASARDSRTLVESTLRRLLTEARQGSSHRESVELFGPPAQLFLVATYPFQHETGVGALAVVEDRSDARRTETVRRDFVANISHELKTPVGALGLLAETILGEDDPEVRQRLARRMVQEADRAAHTIDDLLELSRIEFGDDAEFAEVDVVALAGEAVSRIAAAAEQAGVRVITDVPSGMVVFGDRRQLVSALFNLLDNAVKYSPEGSEVEVRAVEEDRTTVAAISVRDHGVGIPRRALDRIFERFYRVDRARSRSTGGTGLGLAIVRHVVSNHRGRVVAESVEGQGSTFTLLLPCFAEGSVPGPDIPVMVASEPARPFSHPEVRT